MIPLEATYVYVTTQYIEEEDRVEETEHRVNGLVLDVLNKSYNKEGSEDVYMALFAAKTEGGYKLFLYPVDDIFVADANMREYVNRAR